MDDNTNALKGDKDPSEWLPPNKEYHVTYVKNWVEIKTLYGLTFDKKEIAVIEEILGSDIGLWTREMRKWDLCRHGLTDIY